MKHIMMGLGLAILLTACGSGIQADPVAVELTTQAVVSGVAWGERVEVSHPTIPASPAATLQYRIGNGPWQSTVAVSQQAGRIVFDLPEVSGIPDLPLADTTPYAISLAQYTSPLSKQQVNQYRNRGEVRVRIKIGNQNRNLRYRPYGAVEAGEVTLLANLPAEACTAFLASLPPAFSLVDSTASGGLCYATVGFEHRGTSEAIALLGNLSAPGLLIDKNTVQSFDPKGARAFDPSCDQILQWLDPAADSGYVLLPPPAILASSNATAAHNAGITGAGVNVTVIGGGFGSDDEFACVNQQGNVVFEGHDTHVGALIALIAPGANIQAKIVCDKNGNCPTSELVRALLEVRQEAQQTPSVPHIINLSLGGPLPNKVLEQSLKSIEAFIPVISSSGNGPYAPAHYPASYSSGTLNPGSLSNVISVAASGLTANGWQIAGFNSRTAELVAPGVNACVLTATGFRCDPTAPSAPDYLGLTGSSWAAPIATGVAALYYQHSSQSLSPTAMRSCLTSAAQQSPNLNRMIWFSPAVCP